MLARWPQLIRVTMLTAIAVCLFGFGGKVQMELSDLHTVACPDLPEFQNLPTSGSSASAVQCFTIEGSVDNPTDRMIYNADVFGRIYDASGNDVWPERTRLGAIEKVPPGKSEFSIRIGVPANNPLPLQLKQFKAKGFRGMVNR